MHQRFIREPSNAEINSALHLAQMWDCRRLFYWALDRLQQRFDGAKIHPAIVLAIARRHGIPTLIKPAILRLASAGLPLGSWTSAPEVLQYMESFELAIIAKMKENIYITRVSLIETPKVVHCAQCSRTAACELIWGFFWTNTISDKVRRIDDWKACHRLEYIRVYDLMVAKIPEMTAGCREATVKRVAENPWWSAEHGIINGAADRLMVAERVPQWAGVMAIDS